MDVRRAAVEVMIAHARRTAPDECCGLLVGSAGCVEYAVPARNLRASPTRYQIDPNDHFATIHRVRREGRAIVGAYHSHPTTAPIPSPTDLAEAYDAHLLYVIVSLQAPSAPAVRGYRIASGTFEEVPLVMLP